MMRRKLIISGAAALVALAVLAGCEKKPAEQEQAASPAVQAGGAMQSGGAAPSGAGPGGFAQGGSRRVQATAVQATIVPAGTLKATRDTAGVVVPALQSSIAAGVGGIVSRVDRQAGDWVAAGDVVLRIDDAALRLSVANAEASLESAMLNLSSAQDNASQSSARLELQLESAQAGYDSAKRFYDSQKALFDLGGISAQALDNARGQLASSQANLESARLALDQNRRGVSSTPSQSQEALRIAVRTAENNLKQARMNLDKAAIEAPFAGQIASIAATMGMYLGQNAAAFVLVGPERQVSFSLTPSDALDVRQGSRLSFETDSRKYAVAVKQSPSVPVGGMLSLTASIENGASLPFGTVGKVSYVVPLARGAFVPIGSIGTIENRNYLFAIEEGRVVTKFVKVLATSGAVGAVEGLDAGAIVILSPPPGLVDGQEVQATMTVVPDLVAAGGDGAKAAAPRRP